MLLFLGAVSTMGSSLSPESLSAVFNSDFNRSKYLIAEHMKKLIYCIVMVVFLSLSWSCKKSLLDLPNRNAYSYNTYFANDEVLNQAVIATYATLLHEGLWSREYYFIFDLFGYEAKSDAAMQGDLLALAQYKFGPDQPQLQQFWASFYRLILRANVVIDRAGAWVPITEEEKEHQKQYIAEAKFLKAYANFNLVNCYGRIPLRKNYDSTGSNIYPRRNTTQEIWTAIEDDLKAAEVDLPVNYPGEWLGRITKGAGVALLGKVYLYQKKWAEAQNELEKLQGAPFSYSLATNYADLFSTQNQTNPETIFQVMNQEWTDWGIGNQYYVFGGQETWGGKATHTGRAQEYGFNDWKNVFITDAAVKAFTYPNPVDGSVYTDPRAKFTFYGDAASGGQTSYCQLCSGGPVPFQFEGSNGGYRWLKYEYYDIVPSYGGPQSGINGQVIRLADVKLMLAEAYIQQGITGNNPLKLINEVRTRVGAVTYTDLGTQSNAMGILMRERQLELCGEQTRYFDLIRWNIAKQTINTVRAAEDGTQPFQDKNTLFPIPLGEKTANPNIASDITNDWN
jgi:starch-binding outer membrane protein, SusD/RagB family